MRKLVATPEGLAEFEKQFTEEATYGKIQSRLQGEYFYTFGITPEKLKPLLLGPFNTREEAESLLTELDTGEVFSWKTRDVHRASQLLKAEMIKRGHKIDLAMVRYYHHLPKREL